ncbi:hybrid sensor histidine kinase/response regulator [Helicobacter kayseriensis]|uniref:hybrid sensor histidine kinase/response regulator n=1 Tax=Helicobacter kayseriensis TaxID=2905877 RepID=UPI001E39EF94|nr:chemotaxis protein CheW [Helicobacter kayseriensis]MCE3047286.1 chemotaxis protein CheW [Helicobacter kayseriensis]MCE3048657.1 chemotaxis protein CheW [Helicobacter kayseriensis]
MDEMQEILEDFLIESFDLLEQLDQDLLDLEHHPQDSKLLDRIFRVAHTIKGSSSFLGFETLTSLVHNIEEILNMARKEHLVISHEAMDLVLEAIDLTKTLLQEIKKTKKDPKQIPTQDIIKRLQAHCQSHLNQSSPDSLSDEELDAQIQLLLKEQRTSHQTKKQTISPPSKVAFSISPTSTPPISSHAKEIPEKAFSPEQTIRVDVTKLDDLMNLIGELVLAKNRLMQTHNHSSTNDDLHQTIHSIANITSDLQLALMKTRMLPITKVFNKFPRLIRDLSHELHKKIELIILGEDTELDKSIIEEIGDPLVHILRNSCDHGIETPQERIALGKREIGKISLNAYNEGNLIVIEIEDDGRGLDPEALKTQALQKGLITLQEASSMSDHEALFLIFKAGFSTAHTTTNISGRGVGMDVVKSNIEKLHGIIDLQSQKGKGLILKLKIPLTLAITQALIVNLQNQSYAIPLSSVLETLKITINQIDFLDGKNVLRLRDAIIPLLHLADFFEMDYKPNKQDEHFVVIVGSTNQKIALLVDRLIGQEEIVIKPLGEYLKNLPGLSGATIRGDGEIALILDIPSIVRTKKRSKIKTSLQIQSKPTKQHILIVDDCPTSRRIAKDYLKDLEIQVSEAQNGLEALELLKDMQFDAIIIDIEMPKMDGYMLAKEIRKLDNLKRTPLIATTSLNTKEDYIKGSESGMNDYIAKPYSKSYFLQVIQHHLGLERTPK